MRKGITTKLMLIAILSVLQLHLYPLVFAVSAHAASSAAAEAGSDSLDISTLMEATEWIVGWEDEPPASFFEESVLVASFPEIRAYTVKPAEGWTREAWLKTWCSHEGIKYIQPNRTVRVQAAPNDSLYSKQTYLKQIGAEKAWDIATQNTSIKIAVVDTGVDLYHPELKDNLVEGVNLVTPGALPMDDNGHGTNVAGILAAIGNNQTGTTGVLWKAKVMPVKAMEADGSGDETKLGQGIRYAVEHQAKIVVLSLGLYKYSPFLKDITQYAEDAGVLLVAAAGNDGAEIRFPAAYPTVLAVGGVSAKNETEPESNRGPELDIVAPYRVYTTALGGGYENNAGTSMAAPQVAAAAALVWAQDPKLKPYQVRNLLIQTAQDLGPAGWDKTTGYGLLRIDRALSSELEDDMYEPNQTLSTAALLQLDTMTTAALSNGEDRDFYSIYSEYKGTIHLAVESINPNEKTNLRARVWKKDGTVLHTFNDLTKPVSFSIQSEVFVEVYARSTDIDRQIDYRILPEFQIYKDSFEDNDDQYKAYSLPAKSTVMKGTFHQVDDEDWFVIQVDHAGSLQIKVIPDTNRMDIALQIHRVGEKARKVDAFGDGETEYALLSEVLPGKYYVRITDTSFAKNTYPVAGEYLFSVEYKKKYVDPNEPNDKVYQSTTITPQYPYEGVIDPSTDVDYFEFTLTEQSYVTIQLYNIPSQRVMSLKVYDAKQNQIYVKMSSSQNQAIRFERLLEKGKYWISLSANQSFTDQPYKLVVKQEKLVSGFRDIDGHWAETYISGLAEDHIVSGLENYLFKPDAQITRAEAVMMFANALKLKKSKAVSFHDLKSNHWAYDAVAKAVQAGLISGYPDGSFRPSAPISRAEMAMILAKSLKMKGISKGEKPFEDVSNSYWAADVIRQLKKEGWISGYDDGTFKPTQTATRAELSGIIYKLVNEK